MYTILIFWKATFLYPRGSNKKKNATLKKIRIIFRDKNNVGKTV